MADFRRPQFTIRRLLLVTAACAVLFAAFRSLGMSPRASVLVAALLTASLAAAAVLVFAIAHSIGIDEQNGDRSNRR